MVKPPGKPVKIKELKGRGFELMRGVLAANSTGGKDVDRFSVWSATFPGRYRIKYAIWERKEA